ncbi:MAG: glycosyltransferase family 4 protein [Gammaproteobacteria bacterium]
MKKYHILHSLWLTLAQGNAGMHQDARLIFSALSQCESLAVDGFLFSKRKKSLVHQPKVAQLINNYNQLADSYLSELAEDRSQGRKLNFLKKLQLMPRLFYCNTVQKRKYNLYPFNITHQDQLWDCIFSKSLDEDEKHRVMNRQFYHSDLSWRDVMFSIYFKQKVFLNTSAYDFIIFPDVRPITVSPNTKKIIRYHDSFCFLCPDFFQTVPSMIHLNSLKACVNDSYFVCNSRQTHETLIAVYPELEHKSFVIPPIVKSYQKVHSWDKLKQICQMRFSPQSYASKDDFVKRVPEVNNQQPFEYIIGLSTLEPRKNYINLIRAWANLFYKYGKKIKLIIVANPGWLSDEIEKLMQPHVELGNIIHLQSVTFDEIPYLLSHALFFASLSFTEGFGIPPIEAMYCECPILASDIPTYRWSMGDAALFVNPYDVDSMTDGMMQLSSGEGACELRKKLIQNGLQQTKHYHADTIKSQWLDLFEHLKS